MNNNKNQDPSASPHDGRNVAGGPAQQGLSIAAVATPAFEAHVAVEHATLERQLHFDENNVSFLGIYRFTDAIDVIVVAVSTVCAVIAGSLIPVTPVYFSYPMLGKC